VPLELIVYAYRDGLAPEDIIRTYPSVSLPLAYGIIAYYLSHQEEVDAYVARTEAYRRRCRTRRATAVPEVIRRLKALQANGGTKAVRAR